MTFKRGDKVWVATSSGRRPGTVGDADGPWLRVTTFSEPNAYLSQSWPPYALSPRTEHIPELDGEEAPRG